MESQTAQTFLTQDTLIAAAIGFLIGAIIFYLIGKSRASANPVHNPLQKPYDDLKREYELYRSSVNAHFSKTADAVDNLTKSYQDVFTHLSTGAEQLMDKAALTAERQKRQGKAVTLAYLADGSSTAVKADSIISKPVDSASAPVPPRPAEAAKPAAAPKADAPKAAEKSAPEAKPAAPQPAAPKPAEKSAAEAKPAAPQPAPKPAEKPAADSQTPAMKAAEKAGLTQKNDSSEGIEAVKRHLRDNQPK